MTPNTTNPTEPNDLAVASNAPASAANAVQALEGDLRTTGAVWDGHFTLSSGLHSNTYVQAARLLEQPAAAMRAGSALGEALTDAVGQVDAIVAPALGGLIIGFAVAHALDRPFVFTERNADGVMSLRRGFELNHGARVAVVEDVVTTAKSAGEVATLLESYDVDVVAIGSIVRRRNNDGAPSEPVSATAELETINGIPLVPLTTVEATTWSAADCPLCAEDVAMQQPGSRPM